MLKNKFTVAGLIIGLIFLAIIAIYGYKSEKQASVVDPAKEDRIIQANWSERIVGSTGISMIAPDGLKFVEVPLGEAQKEVFRSDLYRYTDNDEFTLEVKLLILKEGTVDTLKFSKDLASAIGKLNGVKKYTKDITPVKLAGKEGHFLKGIANRGNIHLEVDSITLADGRYMWNIMVSYNASSEKIRNLMEKSLNSIKINMMSDKEASLIRIENAGWQKRIIGMTGMNAVAPEKLEKKEIHMDAAAEQGLSGTELYIYRDGDFQYTALGFVAKDKDFDVKQYTDDIISKIKAMNNVQSYDYNISEIEINGIKGLKVDGAAQMGSMKKNMSFATLASGKKLWHVSVYADSAEAKLMTLSDEIFNSIEIQP